ncbi:MAG TPA: cytochrome c1 [Gammaproteobacteria bacterium]|nr:cytochrome c1 [Gammaproteobacteria bacterium]
MKNKLIAILLSVAPMLALASGGEVHLDKAQIDPGNKESLQRGARTFVNYCLSCHSARYQRYNRMARDLGIPEDMVLENLMFTGEKIGDTMDVALKPDTAKTYFGAAPPDLTLIARRRGVDWIYTYLRTFYLDDSRPFGVNNLVFDKVGMPHVLWELQGWQKPVYETETDSEGHEHKKVVGLELAVPGKLSPAEYDRTVRDLVNFLAYMGEPIKLERQALGVKVLIFLFVLFIITYLLKKEYWKDVH